MPDRPEKPRLVWSSYLGDWLLVTHYVSDDNWHFAKFEEIRDGGVPEYRAETPLSLMTDRPDHP